METDPHNLAFPLRRFETATSYVSLLTRYCGLTSPMDLCLDQGFRWQDLVRGDDALFEKVAKFGGASSKDMKRWAVRTISSHQFEVSGQRGTKTSLARARLRVCPRCLVADRQFGGRYGTYRRHFWHFWSVRTCAVHDMPLMMIPSEKYTILNYDFAGQVEKHWTMIERTAQAPQTRPATDFENYVLQRLEGRKMNAFLDAMPMFIATRLCEMLGFVLINGPDRKISDGSDDDFTQAGQAGFEALGAGERGLYEALDTLVTPMALRTVRHQSDLGAFFEWLRTSTTKAEFETLKDKVRSYIFRTYPFRKGDMVLGKLCPVETTFTIHGAWQSLGIQRKRMNRYLVEEGLARRDDGAEAVRLNDKLSSDAVVEISERMSNRLNSFEARDVLNISAEMLQQLRDAEILSPVTDALDQIPKYERRDLETLLDRLWSRCRLSKPAEDLATIIDAARRVRCRASDITAYILDGTLRAVWCEDRALGIAGFLINLDELRLALPTFVMPGITKGEASRLLRVTYPTINYFVSEGLLDVAYVRNPKSRQFVHAVSHESIAAFQDRFETLGQLANCYRRASGPLGCHLEAKGICPIETPSGISWLYERKGLRRRLQKAGLTASFEKVPT